MAAPALTRMGVDLGTAHLFVLMFSAFAAITPPVAVASLVASGIAQTSYIRSAFEGWRIGFPAFLLPFLLVSFPPLMMRFTDISIGSTVLGFIAILIAFIAGSTFFRGRYMTELSWLERGILGIAAAMLLTYLFTYSYVYLVAGALLFAAETLWQAKKRQHKLSQSVAEG